MLEMLIETPLILVVAFFVYFLSTKCCIYTAIAAHLMLTTLGLSPIYCVGWVKEINEENHYHAWIRIRSYNIEQSTLNLYHHMAVDYDDPVVMFDTTSSFIDRMDMLSPLRM